MVPLMAVGGAFVVIVVALLTVLVDAVVDRARAQTAADLAVLAGVIEGPGEARRLAVANGAEVISFERRDDLVIITVQVDRALATAAATLELEVVDVPAGGAPDG